MSHRCAARVAKEKISALAAHSNTDSEDYSTSSSEKNESSNCSNSSFDNHPHQKYQYSNRIGAEHKDDSTCDETTPFECLTDFIISNPQQMNMHISEQNIAESNIPNTEPTKPNEISLNGTDESENLPDLHDDANMSNLIRIYNQKLEVVNAHAHVEQAEIMSKLKIEQAEMISKLKIEQADIMSKLKIEQAEMISKLKMKQIKAICEREKFH